MSSIVPKVNTKPLHRRTQGGRDPSGETQYVWCFYFNKIIIICIKKKKNIFLYVCVFFPPVFPLIIHGKLVSVHARLFFHPWVNQSHEIMSSNRHTHTHTYKDIETLHFLVTRWKCSLSHSLSLSIIRICLYLFITRNYYKYPSYFNFLRI